MDSRRQFLNHSLAASFTGLSLFASKGNARETVAGYGPLVSDPKGFLDLPKGFNYQTIATSGTRMDDGMFRPGRPDGMGAFAGADGKTILVCNHEMHPGLPGSPFGEKNELLTDDIAAKIYDAGQRKTPGSGGTTTLIYDTKTQKLEQQSLSLAGTHRNCAGGVTPWGSWITCEESVQGKGENIIQKFTADVKHGYVFEVPAQAKMELHQAIPLKAMGRFNHEAVAVHEKSGIVYETEDRHEGLIYRFLPKTPGKLQDGGKLQALVARGAKSFDTRNWTETSIRQGASIPVRWMDLKGVDSGKDDLRKRGHAAGAACFARGEGIWSMDNGDMYFACTNGGPKKAGQIWRYVPSKYEGTAREAEEPGMLQLFLEPNDPTVLNYADNLCSSPMGDLILCEDPPQNKEMIRMLGVTPAGECYTFARNHARSEFAGACFSPDGTTLFVNAQVSGKTLAITGPWA